MIVPSQGSQIVPSFRILSPLLRRYYCKDYDNSSNGKHDDTKANSDASSTKKLSEPAGKSAVDRLNHLLASMNTDDTYSVKQTLNIAPTGKTLRRRKEAAKQKLMANDVVMAASLVTSILEKDEREQTESELLSKLLTHKGHSDIPTFQKQSSSTEGGSEVSLNNLIAGMKIDSSEEPKATTRGGYVRRVKTERSHLLRGIDGNNNKITDDFTKRRNPNEFYAGTVNLFAGDRLGIFKKQEGAIKSSKLLSTWENLRKIEVKVAAAHPPANFFEKMILWTQQGKVWRFPIDNEQDWSEDNVDFSEHIFLESQLESWCPNQGPIRHFMELVCVGLSKNPYITAREKRDHILWYQNYFENKKDILKEWIDAKKQPQMTDGKAQSLTGEI